MHLQRTLKSTVEMKGPGLHTGKEVTIRIRPGLPGDGVIFVRADLLKKGEKTPALRGSFDNVVDTRLATTIGKDKVRISTIEHLMAAFQGLGVDNAVVEVDGPELPILDGSSFGFVEAIESVGLEYQLQARPVLKLLRRVEIKVDDKWAIAEPGFGFEVHTTIEWDHPVIGFQEFKYIEGKTSFKEIAAARTFGFLQEVETLKRMGLIQGGSLDNAVVLDSSRVLNGGGLRFPDEFVRHKVLDALGDFKLAGIAMQGRFRLHKPGHELHCRLVQAIFEDQRNYEIIENPTIADAHRPEPLRAAFARQRRVAAY